ncbi:hypothetical protein LSAT2_006614 [Lamellibrachia satsuma]|nr:hypothetical protein LSAT2_006614 [Lamellibrachia satsuma]
MSFAGAVRIAATSLCRAGPTGRFGTILSQFPIRCLSSGVSPTCGVRSPLLRPSCVNVKPYTRGVQTAGDTELVQFLDDEIKLEVDNEKSPGKLPGVRGFEVSKCEGASIVLTKKLKNETVTVTMNVNNSVEDEESADYDSSKNTESQDAQMVSKPPFTVEISKDGGRTLAIQCVFPEAEEMVEGEAQQYEDIIEIQDVTFLGKQGEWGESEYTVQGSIMDGENLYDMLLNLMEERGVDGTFVDELVEFSTAYEHKKYISFLKTLKECVSQ